MDPDLMRAASMQISLNMGGGRKTFQYFKTCPRVSPSFGHRHAFAMRGMPRDAGADVSFTFIQHTTRQSLVNFLHFPFSKLCGKGQVGGIIFRHHQAATCFLIQTVNNARTCHASDPTEFSMAMMQECV